MLDILPKAFYEYCFCRRVHILLDIVVIYAARQYYWGAIRITICHMNIFAVLPIVYLVSLQVVIAVLVDAHCQMLQRVLRIFTSPAMQKIYYRELPVCKEVEWRSFLSFLLRVIGELWHSFWKIQSKRLQNLWHWHTYSSTYQPKPLTTKV